jgi:hypothetical protein
LGTDDSSESCKGRFGVGRGGWDDWEVPGGGGYKEGEVWTRGKKAKTGGIRSGCAAARKKEPCAVLLPTAPGFLLIVPRPSALDLFGGAFYLKKKENIKI